SDPNILETGEQAEKVLHPNTDKECCFNICFEEDLGFHICANCTNRSLKKDLKHQDTPTAPKCDVALPFLGHQLDTTSISSISRCSKKVSAVASKSYFSGASQPTNLLDELTTSISTSTSATLSSFSMMISSSSSLAVSIFSSPVPLLCLFWLCNTLFSSQYSVSCFLELTDQAKLCLRIISISYTHILLSLRMMLLSQFDYQGYPAYQNWRLLWQSARYFVILMYIFYGAGIDGSVVLIIKNSNSLIIRVHRLCHHQQRDCHYHRYHWWIYPCRWKCKHSLQRTKSNREHRKDFYCLYW
ncbi:uncharacterized protein LOC106645285, partial [Copidosoma floridanum]|uniref:uncharacterized protein LOC106645285 n=1 Tax=Copidosoma floridanum TaxID=29053 RepID=UPI0006C9701B